MLTPTDRNMSWSHQESSWPSIVRNKSQGWLGAIQVFPIHQRSPGTDGRRSGNFFLGQQPGTVGISLAPPMEPAWPTNIRNNRQPLKQQRGFPSNQPSSPSQFESMGPSQNRTLAGVTSHNACAMKYQNECLL